MASKAPDLAKAGGFAAREMANPNGVTPASHLAVFVVALRSRRLNWTRLYTMTRQPICAAQPAVQKQFHQLPAGCGARPPKRRSCWAQQNKPMQPTCASCPVARCR